MLSLPNLCHGLYQLSKMEKYVIIAYGYLQRASIGFTNDCIFS
jgi:hypothetical protein